jgi:hypothetical protein
MLPERLIFKYWLDVVSDLVQRHRLKLADAISAVQVFRDLIDARGVNYMTYHNNSEDIADSVAAGWKSGFLKRQPARTP